jgi:hypothetical protein
VRVADLRWRAFTPESVPIAKLATAYSRVNKGFYYKIKAGSMAGVSNRPGLAERSMRGGRPSFLGDRVHGPEFVNLDGEPPPCRARVPLLSNGGSDQCDGADRRDLIDALTHAGTLLDGLTPGSAPRSAA